MTNGSEMDDSSGTVVAAQPRPEVVVRTVWEVNGTSWSTLTRTNYGDWSMTLKVKLRVRRLWNVVDKGTDNKEDDMSALKAILTAVSAEYRKSLGTKSSTKETWEAITMMHVGFDRAKKTFINKLKSHGITIDEEEAVSKYLHSMLAKYIQITLSIQTMLDLFTLTIEDVTGHLRVVDKRLEQATATKYSSKQLLIEEEWAARRNSRLASSSCGGDGKHRNKASSVKKKQVDPNAYRRCGKIGH
ncbi:uncharacterized protein [Miscanthus floridulus]|uniref:uncharacterized protein n=1 Tax=Miscanthus floridulus TaxID=154761 RepID=UPI003457763B